MTLLTNIWSPAINVGTIELLGIREASKIDARIKSALERGLVEEVGRVRTQVGDARLNELGLEYKIVGELLDNELQEVINCFVNSAVVKRKYKNILSN